MRPELRRGNEAAHRRVEGRVCGLPRGAEEHRLGGLDALARELDELVELHLVLRDALEEVADQPAACHRAPQQRARRAARCALHLRGQVDEGEQVAGAHAAAKAALDGARDVRGTQLPTLGVLLHLAEDLESPHDIRGAHGARERLRGLAVGVAELRNRHGAAAGLQPVQDHEHAKQAAALRRAVQGRTGILGSRMRVCPGREQQPHSLDAAAPAGDAQEGVVHRRRRVRGVGLSDPVEVRRHELPGLLAALRGRRRVLRRRALGLADLRHGRRIQPMQQLRELAGIPNTCCNEELLGKLGVEGVEQTQVALR
mmetsp:Transcript_96126/g.276123  ORF Transcript_96126/g.276123 Transcript_96126/m.276123 type:complete len:313 (+) Transcript_96126:1101-2039(+)